MAHSAGAIRSDLGGSYTYDILPREKSLRIAELLPGFFNDDVSIQLHTVEWESLLEYEAVSYAWGDPTLKAPVFCDGHIIEVTQNLHTALSHFRYEDRSRFLWADALCINQRDIPERGLQVKQMKRIYENAQEVQIWLGADTEDRDAATAINAIQIVSDFLCDKLGISIEEHRVGEDTYQEYLLKRRADVPLPNKIDLVTDTMWKSLVWLYSHPYFTRVWVIQEISANLHRKVNVGHAKTIWNRVDLVASYIIMEPAFSDAYGFSPANCWWVATISELIAQPTRWLNILYLVSNYGCLDARDTIYGLRGLMKLPKDGHMLDPDYSKSTREVYRDSVEAALVNFEKADVLLYITGEEEPSWIPRWNIPMLFRNPFRFGKPMPWKPAGDTKPAWSIDKDTNVLSLSGFSLDVITHAESYNQLNFANTIIDSGLWTRNLHTFAASFDGTLPLTRSFLTAAAVSLSFGLSHKINPFEQLELLHNFVAYLAIVLADDRAILTTFIPGDLLEESNSADGRAFGKPVWDFQYPESSIFITRNRLVGCAIATTQPGDEVFVALGRDQGMRQWVWNKEQQQFFYINHVNGSKVWQDDISWDWDEASQKFFYINDGERIYTDCPMPSKTGSSSRWQWDCELRMWFFINDVDGSRLYQQDRSWEWDEALERFFYVDKGKRTYANWKWDWDRHMYDYVEDESRRYEDGSELIRNTNLVDGSDPTIAAPRMIGMQSSIKHEPKQMDTSIKAEEGVMKRTKTETSSSDGVADTLQPLDMNEDDSEAETERLHNTPRKLARTATETSLLSESIYTRTPSKLTHSKTIEHDDSAPPTPTAIADDATMGEAPTTENPGGLPLGADSSNETDLGSHTPSEETHKLPHYMPFETSSSLNWASIRSRLPADWMWDVEYHAAHARSAMQEGCWSCTPLEPDEPKHYPLTIAKAPVVIPVEYQWPLTGGVAPPPDPRATSLIDSRAKIPLEAVRDIFLTFQGSLGFYVLLNGLLQVIVPKDFDTSWASSHLPHKFGGLKIGTIYESLDKEAEIYPNGFRHDVTLVKPTSPMVVKDITSPIPDLGWLNHDSWASLRQQSSSVKILADAEGSRSAKSIKSSRPSDVLVVGEGIFLNQKAAAGGSKTLKDHDASTWKDLVSRALLYRVFPDFDPPNGQSGTALYADGIREDGTQGPGVVGFQSFVQRSGHVQNFEMEGPALERRLQLGRVAFYGAFEVPAELKKYKIV
ncbi:unnamed protein product [Alternaria alternata]